MKFDLLENYKSYKDRGNQSAGELIATRFYRHLSYWIEFGRPEESFLEEFWSLFTDIQEHYISNRDLIDLGLLQTAEAVTTFRENRDDPSAMEFYLFEARLPFFAFIDESAYRTLKNIDFNEIDFQIFEIIQGNFPHDTAQSFLIDNDWVDIWSILRYLDSLDETESRIDLVERMMANRRTIHEKIIFLTYLILTDSTSLDADFRKKFRFPADVTQEFVENLFGILTPFLQNGELEVSWEEKVSPEYWNETLFALLAALEITQNEFTPGWVRLLERCLDSIWTCPLEDQKGRIVDQQPLQEFASSILALLPDNELDFILEVSLVAPIYFENLESYTEEAFQDLMGVLGRNATILLNELEVALPEYCGEESRKSILEGRLQQVARFLGHEINIQNGRPLILNADGSSN